MFTSKFDKLVYVVGIYAVVSFTLKVTTKTVKMVTKELEKAHTKAEAKSASDALDKILDDLSDEEKAVIDNEMLEFWKAAIYGDLTKKTED